VSLLFLFVLLTYLGALNCHFSDNLTSGARIKAISDPEMRMKLNIRTKG